MPTPISARPLTTASLAFMTAAVMTMAGCASSSSPASGADSNATAAAKGATASGAKAAVVAPIAGDFDPKTVVLTMGEKTLTLAELDAEASEQIAQMRRDHFRKLGELRAQALEAYVNEQLLKAEAKRVGVKDTAALLDQEVDKKLTPATDAEAKTFFTENQDRMNGADFEALKERIKGFLMQEKRRDGFNKYIQGLRAKSKVAMTLPVTRVAVAATGPSKGPADAPITIVEFSDYECPYCGKAQDAVQQVFKAYPGKVRLVFRDYPLDFHQLAPKAAEGAHCAGEQSKYWEMHDVLFSNQTALTPEDLAKHAATITGLDQAKWKTCLDSGKMAAKVIADTADGRAAGVDGTPAFFINGILLSGARPFEDFKRVIDSELARGAKK